MLNGWMGVDSGATTEPCIKWRLDFWWGGTSNPLRSTEDIRSGPKLFGRWQQQCSFSMSVMSQINIVHTANSWNGICKLNKQTKRQYVSARKKMNYDWFINCRDGKGKFMCISILALVIKYWVLLTTSVRWHRWKTVTVKLLSQASCNLSLVSATADPQ